MSKMKLIKLRGRVAVVGVTRAACAPATPAPERGEFGELAAFGNLKLDAGSCDYGGKVLSIEAVDELTVVFTLCRPDPAFLATVAFTPFGIQPEEYIAFTGGGGDLLEAPV